MDTPKIELLNEDIFQKHLETILHGGHVDYGFFGISDITTDEFHAEIKSWKAWKNVIGQLTSYNHASPRGELRAYMYGVLPCKQKLEVIKLLLTNCSIHLFHIKLCQDVLTIIDLKDMTTSEYVINSDEHGKEDVDIDKIKQEIKQIYEQSLTSKHKFSINFDILANLLKCHKNNLIRTLKTSYQVDIDYIVNKTKKPTTTKYGGNNYKEVLLTPNCFKRLVISSKTKTLKKAGLMI